MTSLLPSITGSFSSPAAGNPTVAMMEAAYEHQGIDARYLNCEVAAEDLADAVAGARAMGWIGFNCSLPHKLAVIELIDTLARSAELIGAVNCVVRTGDGWRGENTDGQGFLSALRTVTEPAGQHVLVLGAGGASRAIAVELALAGASRVWIANRSPQRAEEIAALVRTNSAAAAEAVPWDGTLRPPVEATVVVNATSLGLPGSGPVPVAFDTLTPGTVVCDVIPNPPDTDFLQRARAAGAVTLDGRGMLLEQAAINLALWTGVDPDRGVMGRALDRAIAGWQHP
ncbi:MAG TPA: shikimate dehydrogenase [Microlunatus sp.]|nr:shikimate dehydrogenase [Microlunatus sp.]